MLHRHIRNRWLYPLSSAHLPETHAERIPSSVRELAPGFGEYVNCAKAHGGAKCQRTTQGGEMMLVFEYVRDHPTAAAVDVCAVAALFFLLAGLWMFVP